jgi:hypothetical protein
VGHSNIVVGVLGIRTVAQAVVTVGRGRRTIEQCLYKGWVWWRSPYPCIAFTLTLMLMLTLRILPTT